MDNRRLIVCLVVFLLPFCAVACPGGSNDTYCPDRSACISSNQNCSYGDILGCVNETIPCTINGTLFCVNDTCDNSSSSNSLCNGSMHFCPETNRCISVNETCCTEHEKACGMFLDYATYFKPGDSSLDMVCDLIATSPGNFIAMLSANMGDNPFQDEPCANDTYYCPLAMRCISTNDTCNEDQTNINGHDFAYFEKECREENATFCPLFMNCVPSAQDCSFKILFDWYASGNTTVDPFGKQCAANQSFCLLSFDCRETCNASEVASNSSCDGDPSNVFCPETLECASSEANCSGNFPDYSNVTAGNFSGSFKGWLSLCDNRELILRTFWQKYLKCKPLEHKCSAEEHHSCKLSDEEFCKKILHYYNDSTLASLGNTSDSISLWLDGCNITVNQTYLETCRNMSMEYNKSCEMLELCSEIGGQILTKLDYDTKMNETILVDGCNITVNMTVLDTCNIPIPTCKVENHCSEINTKFVSKRNYDTYINSSIPMGNGCTFFVDEAVLANCSIPVPTCEVQKHCSEFTNLFVTKLDYDTNINSTHTLTSGPGDGCRFYIDQTVLDNCTIPIPTCEVSDHCNAIGQQLRTISDFDTNFNTTITLANGCDFYINQIVLDNCSIPMITCEVHENCHNITNELITRSDFDSKINTTVSLANGCNITINMTVLRICNISVPEPMSCELHELCGDIRSEFDNHDDDFDYKMNTTVPIGECNITINMTVMEICNISMPEHRNKSCKLHELCDEIRSEFEGDDDFDLKMNSTIPITECNITINMTIMEICNISMPEHRNKSCKLHELCDEIRSEFDDENDFDLKMNSTIPIAECNITINMTVMEICNISMPEHRNKSCKLHELCDEIRSEFDGDDDFDLKMNSTIPIAECNITMNVTVMEICNISMPEHRNKSCKLHELCDEIRSEFDDDDDFDLKMNSTIPIGECNITINMTVMEICNISMPEPRNKSCKLHELCDEIRSEFDDDDDFDLKMNSTIPIGECNITINMTVMEICNISKPEHRNKSCKLHELCDEIRSEFDDDNDFDSKMNTTLQIRDCNVTINMTIMEICNISMPEHKKNKSCELHELCDEIRKEFKSESDFEKIDTVMEFRECEINVTSDVIATCNISDIYYKMFSNGFKVSDSVEKDVTRIAIRELGGDSDSGTWKRSSDGNTWTDLGPVSSSQAVVIESDTRLRFFPDDLCWYGLCTVMYTPVDSGSTGTVVNVSHIPADHRNTLALLQAPPRPVARVVRQKDPVYTVPEDRETDGILISDKIVLNMSCSDADFELPKNVSDYLHEDVLEDFGAAVSLFDSFAPTIAIVDVGNKEKGKWTVSNADASSATIQYPKILTPSDLFRYVPRKNVFGNFTMKFVAVVYTNNSLALKLGTPTEFSRALKGIMMSRKTSKEVKEFMESVLKTMTSTGTEYTYENFERIVDGMEGSGENKTAVKNIAELAFNRVLPIPQRSSELPRIWGALGSFGIFDNLNIYEFHVTVMPVNDQPTVTAALISLPAIRYNLTTHPNNGKRVGDLAAEVPTNRDKPLTVDIDQEVNGIAVVQAQNTSIGSWYYKNSSLSGQWTQFIVENAGYTDAYAGSLEVFLLEPDYILSFRMHDDDVMWSNLEASEFAKVKFLSWDRTDGYITGRHNIIRPSNESSAFSKKSVTAVVERVGCDGRTGSKGRFDRCNICGGDGTKCLGCDNVLYSGAIVDQCGNCTGGNTNLTYNVRKDCAGQCGLSVVGHCNQCQEIKRYVNFSDCNGVCFGGAKINKCGLCAGGSSGKPKTFGEDLCGVCGGDNSTCKDCAGVPNGGKDWDYCRNCLSPNDSSYNSECVKLIKNVPDSGPTAGNFDVIVQGAGLKDKATVGCELVNQATNFSTEIVSSFTSRNGARVITVRAPAVTSGVYKIRCRFGDSLTFYEVENTTYLAYNKSIITYNSVSPSEGVIGTAHNITISGSGFVDTTDLACVSQFGHVFHATYISQASVFCFVPISQKSAHLDLGLSLSRVDREVSMNNISFRLYAEAPVPQNVKFTNSLQSLEITLNHPTKPSSGLNCLVFFKADDVAKFGSEAKCHFRTPKVMLVLLSGRPTILVGEKISFQSDAVVRKFQQVTGTPGSNKTTLTVTMPTQAIVPKAVLIGNSLIGVCASFKLDGSQSYGSGGRRLKYNWTVEWDDPTDPAIDANATSDLADIKSKIENVINGTYDQRLLLAAPALRIGLSYKFTLRVSNFLGVTSKPESLVVMRENKELPELTVGPKQRSIKAALGTTLAGRVRLSSCLSADYQANVLFRWEIDAVGIDLGVVDRPRLRIPRGLLSGGKSYTLTLTARMQADVQLATTATIQLDVESSPLKAIIKGGEFLVIGEDESLVLDASSSFDPDLSTDTASYEWQCYDANDDPCFVPDPANPGKQKRLVIPSNVKTEINTTRDLETNSIYVFKLIYRKGSRSSETEVPVQVKPGSPPAVVIRPLSSNTVNPTEKIVIRALVKSKKTVTATWTCVEEDGLGYVDLTTSGVLITEPSKTFEKDAESDVVATFDMVINKDQLESNAEYKFRLTAEHADASSKAEMSIMTNGAPSKGTLMATPASGFFRNTSFTFSASEGWSDSEDSLPLLYRFGYMFKDPRTGDMRDAPLRTPIQENTIDVDILPQGEAENNYTLTIFVDVLDRYKATTRQTAEIIVRPTQIDASDITELASSITTDFEIGDVSKGAAMASAILEAISDSGSADENVTKALKVLKKGVQDHLLSSIESGDAGDASVQEVLVSCLQKVTSDCSPDCEEERVMKSLAIMVGAVEQQSNRRRRRRAIVDGEIVEMTGDEASNRLEIMSNVLNAGYSNATLNAKKEALVIIISLEQSLCKGLATGEPAKIATSNVTVIRAYRDAMGKFSGVNLNQDMFREISSSTVPQYIDQTATYLFGDSVNSRYGSWSCITGDTCTGMCIASAQYPDDLLITHDPSEKNITRLSDVISLRLYNPQTVEYIPISGLDAAVTIRFPVKNINMYENYTMECFTWDDGSKQWVDSGCSYKATVNGSLVECTCSQLGYVAVFKGKKISPTQEPTKAPSTAQPEPIDEAIKVEFAFNANYSAAISGNTTEEVFVASLRPFLASLLNISASRIIDMEIRQGSIIVLFSILPANGTAEATANATAMRLKLLVSGNSINFTVPNLGLIVSVDPTSFRIITSTTTAPTTVGPTDDDDGLSTIHIVIIAVVCSLVFILILALIVYCCLKNKTRTAKISPRGSRMDLQEQPGSDEQHQHEPMRASYVNNNLAVEYDEKAV